MSKIILIIISCLFLNINALNFAGAFNSGQIVSNITDSMGLGTKFYLPDGEWTVIGAKSLNGGVRPVEAILIQRDGSKIKAILNIKFARDLGPTQGWDAVGGWKPKEHFDNNNCDDYNNQRSNFHNANIEKKKQNLIIEGSCLAIFVRNYIFRLDSLSNDSSIMEAFEVADDYILRNDLELPEALIVVGSTYFTEKNQVHTYYMANPQINNINSKSQVEFRDSEWNYDKINSHTDKKAYMDNAISIGKTVRTQVVNSFKNGNTLDLRSYNEIVSFKNSISSSSSNNENSPIDKLKKLKEMLEEGLITQKQYEKKSKKILEDF